jgi:hypothetical protein
MSAKRIGTAVFGLVLGLGFAGVRADDPAPAKVDNPLFTAWSKCEVGATMTLEADVESPDGQKVHITITDTLKEKTADGVKIESVSQHGEQKEEPKTATFPAKLDAADAKKTGDEDVKAMDKTFKCKVYDVTFAAVGGEGDMKDLTMTIDVNDDVPGGIVKAVFHAPDGKEIPFTVTAYKAK